MVAIICKDFNCVRIVGIVFFPLKKKFLLEFKTIGAFDGFIGTVLCPCNNKEYMLIRKTCFFAFFFSLAASLVKAVPI